MDDTERIDRLNDLGKSFLKILEEDLSYFEDFHNLALEFRGDLLTGKAKVETEKLQKELFKRLHKDIGKEEKLLTALQDTISSVKQLLKLLKTTERIRWTNDLRNELEKVYIKDGLTAPQIAETWSVTVATIQSALKRFRIRKQDYQTKRQISLFPE